MHEFVGQNLVYFECKFLGAPFLLVQYSIFLRLVFCTTQGQTRGKFITKRGAVALKSCTALTLIGGRGLAHFWAELQGPCEQHVCFVRLPLE
jgi:hypothetical protein